MALLGFRIIAILFGICFDENWPCCYETSFITNDPHHDEQQIFSFSGIARKIGKHITQNERIQYGTIE